MPIQQMNPPEAKAAIDENPEAVYLDVRTEMEFEQGHPEGAINVPVAFPQPGGGMQLNAEFLSVVEKVLPHDKQIICGCQAGMRSQRAAEIMEGAGYENLVNVDGGFGGKVDQNGMLVVPGWRDSDLPVSAEVTDDNSYQGLKKKAGL